MIRRQAKMYILAAVEYGREQTHTDNDTEEDKAKIL